MNQPYEIILESRSEKDLDKVPKEFYQKIDKAILTLSRNPRPFGVKKLEENIYRIRVNDWRILFALSDKDRHVVILRVARRNEKTYKEY